MGTTRASHPGKPSWAGRSASGTGPCARPGTQPIVTISHSSRFCSLSRGLGRPQGEVPGILTNMKKLKTNIRYFMQLRQSPSMAPPAKQQGSGLPLLALSLPSSRCPATRGLLSLPFQTTAGCISGCFLSREVRTPMWRISQQGDECVQLFSNWVLCN